MAIYSFSGRIVKRSAGMSAVKVAANVAGEKLHDETLDKTFNFFDKRDGIIKKGIVYIPDTLINSGGVIGLTKDYLKRDDTETEQALRDIANRVKDLMIESQESSISIYQALNNRSL